MAASLPLGKWACVRGRGFVAGGVKAASVDLVTVRHPGPWVLAASVPSCAGVWGGVQNWVQPRGLPGTLTRVPPPFSLQSRGSGGLLHLPGHLLGHHLVPVWVHLLFCLEEAKMPQLWSKLHLKGTTHLAFLHPAVFF